MLRSAIHRRSFLKASAGALAASMGGTTAAVAGEPTIELPADHRQALQRRRCRIVVQYDCQTEFGLDFDSWLTYRFAYADEPGTQIDALWWDMGRLGNVFYPSRVLNQLKNAGLEKWRRQGIDLVGRLVEETRKRNREVFWHHRVSEVDLDVEGAGAAWQSGPDPLKRAHPDWVLRTWWKHGLWNFAVPQVRQLTVDSLREVAERYDLDGVQIDFARHVPCLPPGRQWELRHHVTELMRMARRMLLEVARRRGRPILLAAKVPRNLAGCRVDGLDVETWARQRLVDIFTLGSRSMDVDVGGFRRITAGSDIQLQPCLDDHHATDGYRYPPIELLRGVFGNWWQQEADAVVTFNWSNAPPEWCRKVGAEPGPLAERQAYHEVGLPQTLRLKDKMFAVERRGGYPWAEGFFGRNDTAPLPLRLAKDHSAATLTVRICDDAASQADQPCRLRLRCVLFGAVAEEQLEVRFNGEPLRLVERDPAWKDPQIFSPAAQPASGGSGHYRVDPAQRLLRLDYAIDPRLAKLGENRVELRVVNGPDAAPPAATILEKLEVHLHYLRRGSR
jgi:hypothetical protein